MNQIRKRAALFDKLLADRSEAIEEFRAAESDLCKAADDAFLKIEDLAAFREFRDKRRKKKNG